MDDITYTMDIEGMTCAHCEQTVSEALAEAGAMQPQANFQKGEATFKLPADANLEAVSASVRDYGYTPGKITQITERAGEQRRHEPQQTNGHLPKRGKDNDSSKETYDLVVIGSGGAAMAAAITAVGQGARVAMVERGTIGGTCVNIGCVPSKTLLRGSEVYYQAAHHLFEGVETSAGNIDMSSFVAQKDELVAQMRKDKYVDLIEDYGWELIRGQARFVDKETIEVGDRRIRANAYIIATGADPAVPPIPGLEDSGYLTSTSALALTELPSALFVIGAGYIALELGQLFHRLGSKVTIVQRGSQLLDEYEPEIGEVMREVLEEQGIQVITGARAERVEKVERADQRRRVQLTIGGKRQVYEASHILVATGRTPNVADLNLEDAGVEIDERGAIVVDEQLRTSNPHVWAAGDVTLGPQFVYVASYEGKLAAENALRGAGHTLDFTALPGVIFTNPQVAVVGLTEREAHEQGRAVKITVLSLDVVPRAQVNHDARGLVKLVAEEGSNRILGVHMVAENAGDVIYAGTLAVKFGLTIEDLVDSFAPYLTMSEGLKLAALSFGRDVHKLSCCAA